MQSGGDHQPPLRQEGLWRPWATTAATAALLAACGRRQGAAKGTTSVIMMGGAVNTPAEGGSARVKNAVFCAAGAQS